MRFDIYFGTRPAILFEDLIALEIIHPHDKQGDLKRKNLSDSESLCTLTYWAKL